MNRQPVRDVYQLVVYSKNRQLGSLNQVQFKVPVYPKHILYRQVQLKSVFIPFAFKNITSTYGDRLIFRVTPDKTIPAVFYDINIHLSHQYVTITQLLTEINAVIAENIVAQGIPIVFSFSLSGFNNKLQINTSSLMSQFDFTPNLLPEPLKSYIYRMLGLNTDAITTFNTFNITGLYYHVNPHTFTDDLPFGFIYIQIDEFPYYTFSTDTTNTTFIVPVSHYKPYVTNGATVEQNNPVTLQSWLTYDQTITVRKTTEKLKTLTVTLTDEYHNSILEHAGNLEWGMVLDIIGE